MSNSPPFYDDLKLCLDYAWQLLEAGASDRTSGMHTPVVVSVGIDGRPHGRTVVLRHVDADRRTARFHTDLRSGKVEEYRRNPAVEMVAYEPAQRIQLRLGGSVQIHHDDDVADAAWAGSQIPSRECYRQSARPGSTGYDPNELAALSIDDGRANFAAVELHVRSIEWLFLAHTGHRRARFSWPDTSDGDRSVSATWLAP